MMLMPKRTIQCWCSTSLSRPSGRGAEVEVHLGMRTAAAGGLVFAIELACASRASGQWYELVRVKVRAHRGRGVVAVSHSEFSFENEVFWRFFMREKRPPTVRKFRVSVAAISGDLLYVVCGAFCLFGF